MSSWYLESANHCSGAFKYGEDELGFAGLTKVPSEVVAAPRVGEAAVQFECQVGAFTKLICCLYCLYCIYRLLA